MFDLRIDPLAQAEIDEFVRYLEAYSAEFALEQIDRLERIIFDDLLEAPFTWPYFAFTGPPYRGYLFRVGRRTQYWIIYTADEDARTVDILQFWNAARDPETLDL